MSRYAKRKLFAVGSGFFLIVLGSYVGVLAAQDRSPTLNFTIVEPGKLMRSAQPRPGDLDRILEEHDLGTIFVLRGSGERYERIWAGKNGVPMICIQMYADDPPTDDQISLFFDMMRGDTVDMDRYQDIIKQLELHEKVDEATENAAEVKAGFANVEAKMNSLLKQVESQPEGKEKQDLMVFVTVLQSTIESQSMMLKNQEETIKSLREAFQDLVKTHQQTISEPRLTADQFQNFKEKEFRESWFKRNLPALVGAMGTLIGGIAAVLGWLSGSLGWFD